MKINHKGTKLHKGRREERIHHKGTKLHKANIKLCFLCGKKKEMKVTKTYLDELTYQFNGAAIEVHKALGPGLLESVYHKCLKHELNLRGIKYKSELEVPVNYKGEQIHAELRCDLFVEDLICVELKSVESILPVHEAQLMTYMKLLKSPKGILYNFNVLNLFHEGQFTYVNELFRELPV